MRFNFSPLFSEVALLTISRRLREEVNVLIALSFSS